MWVSYISGLANLSGNGRRRAVIRDYLIRVGRLAPSGAYSAYSTKIIRSEDYQMNFKLTTLLTLIALGASAAATAECTYPQVPDAAPSGATATEPALVAAIQDMKRFNAEITAYTTCVDQDADAQVTAGGTVISSDQIKKIRGDAAKQHNASVDDLQKRADALNAQVKIYKARASAK
jgi:hypothetical protein